MRYFASLLVAGWLILVSPWSLASVSLQQLIDAGEFSVDVQLLPDSDIVPGQEVQLQLILSTNRWFASGTRLHIPEMRNMLVLQREAFAVNSSRYAKGQTWVVQTWELSLFPQREGVFQTPAVALEVKVNHEQYGVVEGRVLAPVLEFQVTAPASTRQLTNWVSTPSLQVARQFDRPLEDLQVGDALRATITIRGENLIAMMLPQYRQTELPGLAAYPQQSQLFNDQQRGERAARRVDVIDYMIEKGGEYQLPEQVFYWWNTDAQSLELAVIPAVSFQVAGSLPASVKRLLGNVPLAAIYGLAAVLALALLLRLWLKRRRRESFVSQRKLARRIRRDVRAGNREQACRWLYYWLDHYPVSQSEITLRALADELNDPAFAVQVDDLLDNTYSRQQTDEPSLLDLPKKGSGSRQSLRQRLKPSPINLRLEP